MIYEKNKIELYASSLAKVASLSNLFSESETPFLHYRTTEYLYSRVLGAKNFARSDIAVDAAIGNVGVGIKTFVYSGRPKFEKIAEFNKDLDSYTSLSDIEKLARIAELRNDRIDVAGKIAGVDEYIYHCIARLPGLLYVFEESMPYIDVKNIQITAQTKTNISFTDGQSKYKFSLSKSTLYKEFYGQENIFEKPVVILKDPFELLNSMELSEQDTVLGVKPDLATEHGRIVLPLYGRKAGEKHVFERSGLNQWNADGRIRNPNELYIPIPSLIRSSYPDFLPNRNTPFDLHFPNGDVMKVKVSQDDGKALMSQHNADLGEWLLRDILGVEEGMLVTYSMLEKIGIDAVEISNVDGEFHIDFKQIGTYEEFIGEES